MIENAPISAKQNLLPMGVSEGCRLLRNIPKDEPITYADIELPQSRLCDQLRARNITIFASRPRWRKRSRATAESAACFKGTQCLKNRRRHCEGGFVLRRFGMRMREYSEALPKPMVPIGYRPILWHIMKYYAHYGHKDFILCLGYKADVIKDSSNTTSVCQMTLSFPAEARMLSC